MGLSDNPSCRKCGTEEEISAHILCIWVPSFLGPEDIRVLGMGAIWNFVKWTGLL